MTKSRSKKMKADAESRKVAALYVRVSTDMQAEGGESLGVQLERLTAAAKDKGFETEVYRDAGRSAKDIDRPEYQRMRADLEAGRIKGVIATKLDRLWRSLAHAVAEVAFIRECGADLIILDDQFDTTTAAGRAMLNMMLTFGEFEREATAERVRTVMTARAREGKFNGGPIPYGYGLDKATEKLVRDDLEAAVVEQIFEQYEKTKSVRRVRRALEGQGIKTRRGKRFANETIRRMLSTETYIGVLVYNKRTVVGTTAHELPKEEHIRAKNAAPALVSKELYDRVQEILASKQPLHPRAQAASYLLSGLVKCELCEKTMYGHTYFRDRKPGGKKAELPSDIEPSWLTDAAIEREEILANNRVRVAHAYYRCVTRTRYGKDECEGNVARAVDVERGVLDALFDLRVNPDRLLALESKAKAKRRKALPGIKRKVAALERRLAELASRERRIMEAFEAGAYSTEVMQERREALGGDERHIAAQLEDARARLADTERDIIDVDGVVETLKTAYDAFETLSFEGRRSMLRSLIDRIVVGKTDGVLYLRGNIAEIGAGLFEADIEGKKKFELGGPDRVPWEYGQVLVTDPAEEMADPSSEKVAKKVGRKGAKDEVSLRQRMGRGSLPRPT